MTLTALFPPTSYGFVFSRFAIHTELGHHRNDRRGNVSSICSNRNSIHQKEPRNASDFSWDFLVRFGMRLSLEWFYECVCFLFFLRGWHLVRNIFCFCRLTFVYVFIFIDAIYVNNYIYIYIYRIYIIYSYIYIYIYNRIYITHIYMIRYNN